MPLKFHSIDIGPEGDPVIRGFNEYSSEAKFSLADGMHRVMITEREDLRKGLKPEELLRVYNYLTPKTPIKSFATDDRGVKVVWNQLQGIPEQDEPAPPGRQSAPATATEGAEGAATPGDDMPATQTNSSKSRGKKTPAAVIARGKGPVKAAKATKTKATKAAKTNGNGAPPRKVGVIDEIKRMTQRASGASVAEIVESLVKKFPERPVDGMTTTVRIQVQRLPSKLNLKMSKEKDEKRGLVYSLAADKK